MTIQNWIYGWRRRKFIDTALNLQQIPRPPLPHRSRGNQCRSVVAWAVVCCVAARRPPPRLQSGGGTEQWLLKHCTVQYLNEQDTTPHNGTIINRKFPVRQTNFRWDIQTKCGALVAPHLFVLVLVFAWFDWLDIWTRAAMNIASTSEPLGRGEDSANERRR